MLGNISKSAIKQKREIARKSLVGINASMNTVFISRCLVMEVKFKIT